MSPATSRLAIVSTPLPLVDRRALSQAWYSALHLAAAAPTAERPRQPAADAVLERAPVARDPVRRKGAPPSGVARPPANLNSRRPNGVPIERRGGTVPLARKVVRAFEKRLPVTIPAGVVLRTESGRVHVIVRRDGTRLRLVALCASPLRDRVARALAQARYSLAARGVEIC
jgi:hypothetical protein